MANSAYVKLVEASKKQEIALDDLKDLFYNYRKLSSKTGDQLDWNYDAASFPYELKEKNENGSKYLMLDGKVDRYHYILLGVNEEKSCIQVTLPDNATHGDKGKANEFCKYLANVLEGELHLFNKRVMYFYKRK